MAFESPVVEPPQIERTAERVTKLVVQCHANRRQALTAERRAMQGIRSGADISWVIGDDWQRAREPGNSLHRYCRCLLILVFRIERFNRMRDCVDAAGARNAWWQRQCQSNVVNYDVWQNFLIS